MLATIFLPPGTERVTVRDIPRLIADAIHPPLPDDTPRVVSCLQKEATTPEQATEWCGSGNNFPVGLTDEDWQVLNGGVWAGLSPLGPEAENDEGAGKLKVPLSEPQWEQYRVAYAANPPRSWRLYVVWRNTVLEQSLIHREAQRQWEELLEQQAAQGELVPRSPTSLIPTPGVSGRQLHESFLTVDEFAKFAAQFSVDVRVIRAFTRPESVVHTLATRRDVLDPVIDLAEKAATNADDRAAVWNAFTALAMAKDKPHPLLGFADRSVQYLDGDDPKFLTRDAFNKRWERRKGKAGANRR